MNDQDYFLDEYKKAVALIEQDIIKPDTYLPKTFPLKDPFQKELEHFIVHGGKRFRPALSLIIAQSFGQNDIMPHLALETFHKYLLVHDDIIDQDMTRYGAPTFHAKMSERQQNPEERDHFGRSLAIIGGDLMAAVTHAIILNAHLTDARKVALERLIIQAIEEVSWGWYDQFLMDYLPLTSRKLTFNRIENSIIWVTGKYSIKLPLLFGFTLAGVTPPEQLEAFADSLGALYQTGDDIIGLFGDEEETGKSNHGDITQGKKTLPVWLSYVHATAEDKASLAHIIGKKDASEKEIEAVRDIIHRSGGLHKTEQLMKSYRDRCLKLLEAMDLSDELKRFFRGFIEYIEKRSY